ncbi:hypothetical protein FQN60_016430 [Etheostoma spectabile]|uniref:Uncharacterized protein n=1 Tax=Etheostoma spectabile TaxID=54343 RepID=A0A5J5CYL4_9PERO|nr:hypothetical protein FQN60_016430 [Etheostoma spectabile]
MVLDSSGKNCHPPPQLDLSGCKMQERMRCEGSRALSPQQCFVSTIHFSAFFSPQMKHLTSLKPFQDSSVLNATNCVDFLASLDTFLDA